MSYDRYPLRKLIIDDLLSSNKFALLLLFLVIVSAVATVFVIHKTRYLNTQNAALIFEKQALENSFVHLKLEEDSLDGNVRIIGVARRLTMGAISNEQQVIIIEPSH